MGTVKEPAWEVFREHRGQYPLPGRAYGRQEKTSLVEEGRDQEHFKSNFELQSFSRLGWSDQVCLYIFNIKNIKTE